VSDYVLYFYDDNGNLLSRLDTAAGWDTYSYNNLNQLIAATAGGMMATYTYDTHGIRTGKCVEDTNTTFLLDGSNVAAEVENNAVSANYLWGANPIRADRASTVRYFLYNAHGDVVQLTDGTGTLQKSYTYDAFGNEKNPSSTDVNPFRYCGEYWDSETGTYYLRARYYDPVIGRFLAEDPSRAGLNWYIYCSNSPIAFIDPLGLVEVGLRAYAATYEGSSVVWDNKTRTASVTWNGKTLKVDSTAQNTRDGHIYVDDSLFINAFGTGGKLNVYQDAVTGNISIRASFYYHGKEAYERIPGSGTSGAPWGISYQSAFLQGIEDYWSGTFGQYEVSTYARYNGKGIRVLFNDELGVSNMQAGRFGWSKSKPGKITMYNGYSNDSESNGDLYSISQFMWVSAHEFGHILGVSDAYNTKNSTGVTSIYNVFGTKVQEGDIAMVLNAWSTGKWQKWP